MRVTVLLLALASAVTFAADNTFIAPQSAANPQSAIDNRQSSIVNGVDAITIPQMLSYQGKLTDSTGVPVPNSDYSVTFALYATSSGGSPFWSEAQSVTTKDGLFSTLLGSVTPISSVPAAGALYLGMAVAGGAELVPRLRIASAAYAYLTARASDADLLQGKDTTALDSRYVNEGQADAVTGAMLVNGTVLTADVGDTAVTMAKIAQAGATTGQVVKWTGSAWAPGPDNTGGGSGVTNVYQDTGIICVPNPITSTGNVKFDLSYGDGRYVNVTGDSLTGALRVQGDLRVYGKGRIGPGNSNAGNAAFVAGEGNTASANYASVPGGADNSASAVYSHIGGGGENRAAGDYSTVGGGGMNYASGGKSTVAGGSDNEAYGHYGAIGGGRANTAGDAAADTCATVAGGRGNLATGMFAFVGGGKNDTASGPSATVAGGEGNRASGFEATVGGGWKNSAGGSDATVGGGYSNDASGSYAFVGGGSDGTAAGSFAVVAGGSGNGATGRGGFVGGGIGNTAGDATGDTAATVAGGKGNLATAMFATVGGGQNDTASHAQATVGGGGSNLASGDGATVAGGWNNTASGIEAMVGGGQNNTATATCAVVGGGSGNSATGFYSMVPGGYYCQARGYTSLAAGRYARAGHGGAFVWSDSCSASDSVYTGGDNQWRVRARGGAWFYSNLAKTTGVYLAPGSNSWESACDSMTKEDFRTVDRKALLDKVAALRVRDYKMKDQNDGTRHIGPVAQDFHNSFGYGGNETSINMADADGVALAAIQALYEDNKQLRQELEALKAELAQQNR